MLRKLLLLLVLVCPAILANGQTVTEPAKPEDEKLNKAAVEFLRETLNDVNSLRSLENRISFTSELAGLMWFRDEREARTMFGGVIADFQQLIAQYDREMNALGTKTDEDGPSYLGGFMADETDRNRIQRKFRTAMAVRQQIAMSIAEHDPDLAFSFYYDSLAAVTNPDFRKQNENSDRYFEFQLMNQIAAKSPAKAAKFASKSLANGFNSQHVELLKKIYAADPDIAADFASDILSKVKGEKLKRDDLWPVSSLISFGSETLDNSRKEGGKKAIYSRSDLRDLAETMALFILDNPDSVNAAGSVLFQIEKFAPTRAAQIRAKMNAANSRFGSNMANTMRGYEDYDEGAVASNSALVSSNSNRSRARQAQDDQEKNQKQMMDDVQKVANKDLPKEQRDNIIAQARKILMATPGRDKKVMGLSMLAAQVAKAGDKDLAAQIMKDAEGVVSLQPKNYQDFLLVWLLAAGYASSNPDKAFPILDETIGRANETLAAFVKVAEFIDTNEEIIQDGEVQVGAFGGAMISGLTRELGSADGTLLLLAKADFDKTKSLAYKFERPEIRILAKMLILRAVLGDKNPQKSEFDLGVGDEIR